MRWLVAGAGAALAHAAPENLPLALRQVDPNKLSGGVFAALDAHGAFGETSRPPLARAGYPDLAKGKPPAVLDARVGANVRLGEDPAALPATQRGQAEAHLFRSVIAPDTLLAGFQDGRFPDGGALDCGYALSRDGGLTWTRALIPQLTVTSGGAFFRATDPVAAIGPQGDMYLNTLGSIDNAFGRAAIVVSRSTDNGATWTSPLDIYRSTTPQIFPDKNWLAVNDFPGAPNSGRLVCTWTQFTSTPNGTATGNNLIASVSNDRGATWTSPIPVTPAGSNNQGSLPLFLPDGSLVLVYITFIGSTTQFSIQCKRSVDGGLTYPASATTVVASVNGWDDPELRDGVFLPSAAIARTSGEIFVTYTAVVSGTPRVLATKSSDFGATWTSPVIASDNPAGRSVMNPAIAATADGRTVTVVFMDKRLAPNGRGFVDHYAAISTDGGATWLPNIRLTEMSSDIRYGPQTSRGVMLGDYLGVTPPMGSDQAAVAIWCDTRTGDSDPFTVRFAPSNADNYSAWCIARRVLEVQDREDLDRDGATNLVEYVDGTDPRRPDSGEALVLGRSAGGSVDVFWTERTTASTPTGIPVPYVLPNPNLVAIPSRDSAPRTTLSGSELPSLALRPGLQWRGVRAPLTSAGAASGRGFIVTLGQSTPNTGEPMATIGTDSRFINVSTRAQVRTGAGQLIAGFVIDGPKRILVRAAGPALAPLGVAGVIADPQLRLEAPASDALLANNNWQQGASSLAAADATLFARLGAFPFPANSLDAALTTQLGAQAYTAIVSNAAGATGIALVEAYDADATPGAPGNPRLLNLSTRADVGTGDNALVAGFVIRGTQPRRVLVRAVGPTLASFGVGGVLADPLLTLYRDGALVATNDDWEISRSSAAIAATAQRVGAFPLAAASLDAALLLTLAPGNYTAVVTGVDGATGVALVEIYDAD